MNIIKLLLVTLSLTAVGGCYEFAKAPIPDKDLVSIRDTILGKKMIALMADGSLDSIEEDNLIGENSKVFLVNDDIILIPEKNKDEESWSLNIVIDTPNHILICQPAKNEDLQFAASLKIEVPKGRMESTKVDGPIEDMKKMVIELAENGNKICLAVPYKH
jgi:hypothetical protein